MNITSKRSIELIDKFTDVEIHLRDQNETIKILAHRFFLAYRSDYFNKLFTYNTKPIIEMIVDDATVMKRFILTMYGIETETDKPKWEILLENFKCQQYLLIESDVSELYDLIVPNDYFEILLEIVTQFDLKSNFNLRQLIKRNMPPNYDLGEFPNDSVENLPKNNVLVYSSRKCLNFWSIIGRKIIAQIPICDILTFNVSKNNLTMAVGCDSGLVFFINTSTYMIENSFMADVSSIIYLALSTDSRIVTGSKYGNIRLWDILSNKTISMVKERTVSYHYTNCLDFSLDNTKIILTNGEIIILDLELNQLDKIDNSLFTTKKTFFYPANSINQFISCCEREIRIQESHKDFVRRLGNHHKINDFCIDPSNENQLFLCDASGEISQWNIEKLIKLKSVQAEKECIYRINIDNSGNLIYMTYSQIKIINFYHRHNVTIITNEYSIFRSLLV